MRKRGIIFAAVALPVALSFFVHRAQGRPPAFLAARTQSQSASAPSELTPPGKSSAGMARHVGPGVTAYTLPPALYKKARELGRIRFVFEFVDFFFGLAALWLILRMKFSAKFRDWAESWFGNGFLQAASFTALLIVAIFILELPLYVYGHWVSRSYGISIQGWGSWAWSVSKSQLLEVVVGSILVWVLYGVMRKSPRRWWIYFWLISLPLVVFMVFVEPYVIEPLFNQFAPLAQKDPQLVAELERVVHRAGMNIPPGQMLWMKASDKTPAMNAYVSGIGASQRVVVWDTTIAKETTPEIAAVFGHEMGHYVLGHVWKGTLFFLSLLFIFLWLGFHGMRWALRRWGASCNIRGVDDLASLPVLLLLASIFAFAANPIANGYSRQIEHQADVYGLEVTHGVIPDAGEAAAASLQAEGEAGLADPQPNPLDVFLFYTHPPLAERIRFALTYDPWTKGKQPEFVK